MNKSIMLDNEDSTLTLGAAFAFSDVFAECNNSHIAIYLNGCLGAGKTTLVRGLLRALGYKGVVKSPTYTIVENYQFGDKVIYHFDLYRLGNPEELDYIGIRDYVQLNSICIFEWPDKGYGWIPIADVTLTLEPKLLGRCAKLESFSNNGAILAEQVWNYLEKNL